MEREIRWVENEDGIFEDFSEVEKADSEKRSCSDFTEGECDFYQGLCFHSASNRCYRVRPRDESELAEWMDMLLCSDCNEVVCNDCHAFRKYQREVEKPLNG